MLARRPGVISRPWKARPKALIPSTGIPPRRRRIQRAPEEEREQGPRHARGANRSASSGGEGEPRARRPRHRRTGASGTHRCSANDGRPRVTCLQKRVKARSRRGTPVGADATVPCGATAASAAGRPRPWPGTRRMS
jgi:hypothetical protein